MNHFLKTGRRKRRVLVVDDELINRELLETILSFDYDVKTVPNGIEAMDTLRSDPDSFSLILLDIIMPKMTGFDVIEACMADDRLKNIPIIVMTSEKSAEVRSIHMGAADFISKPYRMPEVIIARCERIIEQSEEQKLIRSIETDPVTGLYIKLFFDAYVKQLASDVKGATDVIALKLDGADNSANDAILKKVADLMQKKLIGSKGFACRADDDIFYGYCKHKANYEELVSEMAQALDECEEPVSIRVGICEKTDSAVDVDVWYQKAIDACNSAPENGVVTVACSA